MRVERTIKGKAPGVVALLEPEDREFRCDLSRVEAGQRALFFLTSGYRILFSIHDCTVTSTLTAACVKDVCALESVMTEIEPDLGLLREERRSGRKRAEPQRSVRWLVGKGVREGCEIADETATPPSSATCSVSSGTTLASSAWATH